MTAELLHRADVERTGIVSPAADPGALPPGVVPLLTMAQAETYTQLSRRTITRAVELGRLREGRARNGYQGKGDMRFRIADLEEWLFGPEPVEVVPDEPDFDEFALTGRVVPRPKPAPEPTPVDPRRRKRTARS